MIERTTDRSSRAAARARRVRRSAWQNLFADPVRKVISLALAIGLWILVNNQVTDQKRELCRLSNAEHVADSGEFQLVIQLPGEQFRVKSFSNPIDDKPLTSIEVSLEAPQLQLRNMLANPMLFVKPRQGEINQNDSTFVFDQTDLRSTDDALVRAIREIQPRRVSVKLERVETEVYALKKDTVDVALPDASLFPYFQERLRLDKAVFTPSQVTLRGPKSALAAAKRTPLFKFDLSKAGSTTEPNIIARVVETRPEGIEIEGLPIEVSVPLDPQFDRYELVVPVLVDHVGRPTTAMVDYEHDATVPVSLLVSGELTGTLSRMSPAEREAWARDRARVYVHLDRDWSGRAQIFLGTLMLTEAHYERGRHYRTDAPVSVQIRPKKGP